VDDLVAAAALQLRRHPVRDERVPELGRRGPRNRPAQARRRRPVLQRGHEQPAIEPVDGTFDEIVQMPHDSPWPALLGLSLLLLFLCLVMGKFGVAGIFGIACVLVLFGWHSKEPQEA
jgi:hypothetical protein